MLILGLLGMYFDFLSRTPHLFQIGCGHTVCGVLVVKIKTSHPTYEKLTTDATFIMNGME